MGKTLILSQKQLNEIIGLQTGAMGNFKEPDNTVSAEGYTTDDGGYSVPGKPMMGSDEFADSLTNKNNGNALQRANNRGAITTLNCSVDRKKKLLEINQYYKNRFFKLDPRTLEALKNIEANSKAPKDAPGRMRISNIIENNGVSYSELNTLKNEIGKLKEDSSEFQAMGGKVLKRFVDRCLVNISTTTQNNIDNKKRLGLGIQKPGGTKQSGNGKAHSKK